MPSEGQTRRMAVNVNTTMTEVTVPAQSPLTWTTTPMDLRTEFGCNFEDVTENEDAMQVLPKPDRGLEGAPHDAAGQTHGNYSSPHNPYSNLRTRLWMLLVTQACQAVPLDSARGRLLLQAYPPHVVNEVDWYGYRL